MHLLLACQRLEEGRLRGLDTHLSYRIGLRTFSALETRAVLGVPDAYELPRSPGHGYLKSGTEPLVRFQAAYVSGPYRRAGHRRTGAGAAAPAGSCRTRRTPVRGRAGAGRRRTRRPRRRPASSLLDVLVDRLAGQGPPAHQVWLPPLAEPPRARRAARPGRRDPSRGLTVANPELHGALQVPVGVVDRPFEQRRDPLWLSTSTARPGTSPSSAAPQSGKCTLLRTLIVRRSR